MCNRPPFYLCNLTHMIMNYSEARDGGNQNEQGQDMSRDESGNETKRTDSASTGKDRTGEEGRKDGQNNQDARTRQTGS